MAHCTITTSCVAFVTDGYRVARSSYIMCMCNIALLSSRLKALINQHEVMLFLKGTPEVSFVTML